MTDPLANPLRPRQPGTPWEDEDDAELMELHRLTRTALTRTGDLAIYGIYVGARQRLAAEWYAEKHPGLYMSAYKRVERILAAAPGHPDDVTPPGTDQPRKRVPRQRRRSKRGQR